MFEKVRNFLLSKIAVKAPVQEPEPEVESGECCEGIVHIAYRGVSDDRQYVAYSRKWPEVKFFKPHGLKVFCAGCRRRLL